MLHFLFTRWLYGLPRWYKNKMKTITLKVAKPNEKTVSQLNNSLQWYSHTDTHTYTHTQTQACSELVLVSSVVLWVSSLVVWNSMASSVVILVSSVVTWVSLVVTWNLMEHLTVFGALRACQRRRVACRLVKDCYISPCAQMNLCESSISSRVVQTSVH